MSAIAVRCAGKCATGPVPREITAVGKMSAMCWNDHASWGAVCQLSSVTPLASELRLAVHRLTRRLRQQTSTDGLTLTQTSALAVIWREGPLSAGDLAAREHEHGCRV